MDLQDIAIDQIKSLDGVWCDLDIGLTVKIAFNQNKAHQKALKKLSTPAVKTALQKGTLSNEKAEELTNRAVAEAILRDWKDLTEKGKPIKYSADKAFEILNDPQYKLFREEVILQSENIENFRLEVEEAEIKNLKKS